MKKEKYGELSMIHLNSNHERIHVQKTHVAILHIAMNQGTNKT